MPRNNTPKNELEQQYEREYNRIIQAINRQKQLGYFVPEELKPIKPSKVKNVTPETVERLIQITPKVIRKNSIFVDKDTGEGFEGLDVVNSHHKARPSTAKTRKSNYYKGAKQNATAPPKENNLNLQIIDEITARIETYDPDSVGWSANFKADKKVVKSQLQSMWEDVLLSDGEYEVAYRINNRAREINDILDVLFYDSDSSRVSFNLSAFMNIILDRALTQNEADWLEGIAENIRYAEG